MSVSREIARWIVGVERGEIPGEVADRAVLSILDTLGVIVAGSRERIGRTTAALVPGGATAGPCRVLGTSRTGSAGPVALANGVSGHALDYDDTTHSFNGHASVAVLPAALAVAEAREAGGAELVDAFVVGTEVACTLGRAVSPLICERGWHTSGVVGCFGATAAVARLLGMNVEQTAHALAITASLASGIKASIGSDAKPLQVGRSSENGVLAATAASLGATGSVDALEGEFGFCATHGVDLDAWGAIGGLGSPYDLVDPGFFLKRYPTCSGTHAAMDALSELIRKHRLDPEVVDRVECLTTPLVMSSLPYPDPRNATEARFSMQFCLAVTLLAGGAPGIEAYSEDRVNDPDVRSMMSRIGCEVDPGAASFAPANGPESARVKVVLRGGSNLVAQRTEPGWNPRNMPSWEGVGAKFRDCCGTALHDRRVSKAIEVIEDLRALRRVRSLTELLSPPASDPTSRRSRGGCRECPPEAIP